MLGISYLANSCLYSRFWADGQIESHRCLRVHVECCRLENGRLSQMATLKFFYFGKENIIMAVSKDILTVSMSVLLLISLSCAKKRDEPSKAGSDKPSIKSFGTPETYYGDPDRIGELKKAVMYFVREQKWQDAETTLRIIIDSNQKHNDKKGLVNNYCFLGLILRMQGKQEQELDSYKRELEIARSLLPREPAWECDALINMGGVQLLMGERSFGPWLACFPCVHKSL